MMNTIIRPFFYSRTHISFYQNTIGVFYLELECLYQRALQNIFYDSSKFSSFLWADLIAHVQEIHEHVVSQMSIIKTISSLSTIQDFRDFVSMVESTPIQHLSSLLGKISLFFPQDSIENMSTESAKLMNLSDADLFCFKALFNQVHTTVQRISQLLTTAIWMTNSHQDTILEDIAQRIKKDLLETVCAFARFNEELFFSFHNPKDTNNLDNYFYENIFESLGQLNNLIIQINQFQTITEAIMSDLRREGQS